jgi:hypothetical protein
MLKPCIPNQDDPLYPEKKKVFDAEMKRYKADPEEWSRPASERHGIGVVDLTPEQVAAQKRGEACERIRRKLCAEHHIDALRLGTSEKTYPIAEMLLASARGDESKVDYQSDVARQMLQSAGLLS